MGISPSDPSIRRAVEKGLLTADAVSGVPALKPKRKRRDVRTGAAPRWAVVIYPACRVVTEANTHEHWTARAKRADAQKAAVLAAWLWSPLSVGRPKWDAIARRLAVTLTHVGPRMDSDNLAGAFKACRDQLAEIIGTDDGSDFYEWRYEQRPGTPGIEVRIEPL